MGGEIGRGGWGIVLEGTHRQLGRRVAIKQLPPAFAADQQVQARFVAEARLLASLDHPHIVPIYDYVETDGLCLLVMEWLPGGTVWDRFTTVGMTPENACALVMSTCAGLQFAHERGVLHRDIKPENIIFSANAIPKITDFGIAKMIGGHETMATRAGEVIGTPAYMAPEQARGLDVGPSTDVYAAGTMLYELLAGRLPFPDDGDSLALLYRHAYEDPVPLQEVAPYAGDPLASVTMKALAPSPADRYSSAEEFGVAVAEAAAASWGAGWLERSDLRIVTAGPIAIAALRPSGSVGGSPSLPPGGPAAPVRPSVALHPRGVDALERGPDQVVPIGQVVKPPPPPRLQVGAALALLIVSVALALSGIGRPERSGDLAPGEATVGGRDVAATAPVAIDLSELVPVSVAGNERLADATDARLTFSVAGVKLASIEAPLTPSGGRLTATADPGSSKFLVAGVTTAELDVLSRGSIRARQQFSAVSAQPFYLTVPGAAGIALLLFVVAYVEALLRPMRRGRKKVTGLAGMVAMGALGGMAVVAGAWLLAHREPTPWTLLVCALTGSASGAAAALAAIRIGRRRRPRPRRAPARR